MTTFAQPVSMQVRSQKEIDYLKAELIKLGYPEEYFLIIDHGNHPPYKFSHRVQTFAGCSIKNNCYVIDHYNPELFLAIAAMTTGEHFIDREWFFTFGKLVQASPNCNKVGYTKPNLQQLINHFTKSEIMQPKVDRNLVIKCANEQEQELVKQWLIDNKESISHLYTSNDLKTNCYLFHGVWGWNNSAHDSDGKAVTPQELGIIPAPIDEFKNGDVVDAFQNGYAGWSTNFSYIGVNPLTGKYVVSNKDGQTISFDKVRKPIKTVTMQQVADKFGYELGTFKIEN